VFVPLGRLAHRLAVFLHAPGLAQIRDACIRVFGDLGSRPQLIAMRARAVRRSWWRWRMADQPGYGSLGSGAG